MQFVNIHTHRPTLRHIEPSSAGVHPWDADRLNPEEFIGQMEQAEAIGETGLDFACAVPRHTQTTVFRKQLEIAATMNKPVILHCVRAFEPIMRILSDYPLPAVVFHGFIGSEQQARQAIAKGYMLSFGLRSFRSPKTVRALQATQLQNLFLETDDDPIGIEDVYAMAAELKGLTISELQTAILENYKRIFNCDEQQLA